MEHLTPAEKQAAIKALESALQIIREMPVQRPCEKCLHYLEDDGRKTCAYHNDVIPAGWLEKGCDSWEWIPF